MTDETGLGGDLLGEEGMVLLDTTVHVGLRYSGDTGQEMEVLLRGEVVDKEGIVDVGGGPVLPTLGGTDINHLIGRGTLLHRSLVGTDEVEDETEKGALAGSVVADEAKHLTLGDGVRLYVDGHLGAEGFLERGDFEHGK